ncbi:MAG: hypothetical protein QG577_1068, partial [Thermodesulfobacteriota bacterium]|nr:hypothetical protein [Thermodesulfobacteriota bacterium]
MGRRFFLTIIAVLAGSLVLGGPWFTPAKSLTYAGAFPKPGKDDRC